MSRIALINIDTQQSFHHRNYWQEDDIPAFQQAMLGLAGAARAVKLDAGFDGDGWKTIGFDPLTAGADFDRAYASCPGPDGTQIVSGMVRGISGSDWIGVVRLRPDSQSAYVPRLTPRAAEPVS